MCCSFKQVAKGQAWTVSDMGLCQRPSQGAQNKQTKWPASDNIERGSRNFTNSMFKDIAEGTKVCWGKFCFFLCFFSTSFFSFFFFLFLFFCFDFLFLILFKFKFIIYIFLSFISIYFHLFIYLVSCPFPSFLSFFFKAWAQCLACCGWHWASQWANLRIDPTHKWDNSNQNSVTTGGPTRDIPRAWSTGDQGDYTIWTNRSPTT